MVQIKSVKRAFDILNLYALGDSELGVTEVATRLKINKSTSARLMATLESTNILKKSHASRKYRLNHKVLELARTYISTLDLKSIVQPFIQELNEQTRELVLVHIIRDDQRYCLTWLESSQPIRRAGPEHRYAPLTAGAPSKLLISSLPDDKIEEILEKEGLHRFTSETITDKAAFLAEIARARQRGYAISQGEHVEMVRTVSAPIYDYAEKMIAALSITWLNLPSGQSPSEEKYLQMVRDTARKISNELGYQNNRPGF